MQNYQSTIKFQDALGFYDTLYLYKKETSEAGEKASVDKFDTVVLYYKKLKKLYKYVSAYILNNNKCEKVANDVKKTLRDEMIITLRSCDVINRNESQQARLNLRKKLFEVIDKLENTEENLYLCIKISQLELPMDTRSPYKSIQQQEL